MFLLTVLLHQVVQYVSCCCLHDYHILPSNSCTCNDHGAEQVDIVAKDEKRAFTLLVATTADGDFLPF